MSDAPEENKNDTVAVAESPMPAESKDSETAETAKKVAGQEGVPSAEKPANSSAETPTAKPVDEATKAPAAQAGEKTETKAEPAKLAAPVKPAVPLEAAFNTDQLQSSTARFTYKAWRLYHNNRKDNVFLQETPIRARLEARSIPGGEEIQKILTGEGVRELSRTGNVVSFTATFETIQKVIRHPETQLLDAVRV